MDAASTVTSLFTTLPHVYPQSFVKNYGKSTPKTACHNSNKTHNARTNSASKLLSRYIHKYEKEQTLNFAKSIANTQRKVTFSEETERNERIREVTREIQLARQLLPAEYSNSNADSNMQSITTDDLLASDPYLSTTYTGALGHCENQKDTTRSMHFSEFSEARISVSSEKGDHVFSKSSNSTFSGNHHTELLRKNSRSWRSLDETKIASKAREQFDSNDDIDIADIACDVFSEEQNDIPKTLDSSMLTKNAGRTPFHHRHRKCNAGLKTEMTLSDDREWQMPTIDHSNDRSFSPSTLSMSFDLDDKSSSVRGFMQECLEKSDDRSTEFQNQSTPDENQQFGSVEKIKNMLFTLQKMSVGNPPSQDTINSSAMDYTREEENEGKMSNGHLSFKKALSHLHSLKQIVCSDCSEAETVLEEEFTVS